MLSSSYPLFTWFVLIAPKDLKYSLKYRLDGFGEMAEWKNDPNCTSNMYMYRVATSKLEDRGGDCTDEDKEKAKKILGDMAKRDMFGANSIYSVNRVAEEVESRLNRDSLHWLIIKVWETRTDFSRFDWSIYSHVRYVYKHGDKYSIFVFLSKWLSTIHVLTLPLHLHLPSSNTHSHTTLIILHDRFSGRTFLFSPSFKQLVFQSVHRTSNVLSALNSLF